MALNWRIDRSEGDTVHRAECDGGEYEVGELPYGWAVYFRQPGAKRLQLADGTTADEGKQYAQNHANLNGWSA